MAFDPVHQSKDGKWYFWNETLADKEGPFDTEGESRKRLKEYGEYLSRA